LFGAHDNSIEDTYDHTTQPFLAGRVKLISLKDLTTGTEYDPAGAEEFVALICALRTVGSRPLSL
jgi:hypothetical protein